MATIAKEELKQFIKRAELHGYAGNAKPDENPDGSKSVRYREDDLEYEDTWKGFDSFGGEEIVKLKGERIWHRVYDGGIVEKLQPSDRIYDLLRRAMLQSMNRLHVARRVL
jgi:hypothetical protein